MKVQLMGSTDPMESTEPPGDLAGKRAWYEAKMEGLRKKAEEEQLDQLKEEARELAEGSANYPPQESLLGEILLAAGLLRKSVPKDNGKSAGP